jgi:hypothetical protein
MFSFGGSKSKSSSSATSQDFGGNVSQSFSDSLSRAVSGGQSTSSSNIAFEDLFRQMYGGATGAAADAAGAVPLLQGQAASLFSSGNQFLQSLQGGPSQDYLQGRMTGEHPLVDQQISALGDDLSRFFGEQLNPQITSTHVGGGTLGGGRQGVAQGMAMDSLGREFQQGALGIRVADMQARDQAARDLGQMQIGGAQTGLGSLGQMFGIAEGGAFAGMAPHTMLSQILGGPTVMNQSQSTQFSESESIAKAISEALGFSYGSSDSSSKGSSKSLNFGF